MRNSGLPGHNASLQRAGDGGAFGQRQGDHKPGEMTCDGVKDVWHLARF